MQYLLSLICSSLQHLCCDGLRCGPSFVALPMLFSRPSQLTSLQRHLPHLTFVTLSSSFTQGWPTWWLCHVNVSSMQCVIMMIMPAWTCLMSSAHTTLNLGCSRIRCWMSCGQRFSSCSLRYKLKWWWVCHCWIIPRWVGVPSPIVLAAWLRATTAWARHSSSGARCSHISHRDSSGCPWVTSGVRLHRSSWLAAASHFLLWRGVIWATSGPVCIGVLSLRLSSTNAGLAWFNTSTVLVAFFTVAVFVMLLTSSVQKMGLTRVGGFPLSYCSKDVQKSIMVPGLLEHSTYITPSNAHNQCIIKGMLGGDKVNAKESD